MHGGHPACSAKIVSLSPTPSTFGPLLFAGDIEAGFEAAAAGGFDGVELSLLSAGQIEYARLESLLAEYGLKVYGIATGQSYYAEGISLFAPDRAIRDRAIEKLREHVDLACDLDAAVIVGGIRGRLPSEPHASSLSAGWDAFRDVAQYACGKNVTILLEPINRYETNIVNTLEQGAEIIRKLAFPNVRLLADAFHMNIEEALFYESLMDVSDVLGYMHFADSNRWAPGFGHTDFGTIWRALCDMDYRGPIGIEVLPLPTDEAAARQGARFLHGLSCEGG